MVGFFVFMRLFIAIRLNDNTKRALTDAQNELKQRSFKGRFTDINNMHLTLAFIGEYNEPEKVLEAMNKVRCGQFSLTLGGYIGNFGNLLWAGIEKEPRLEALVKQLRHCLSNEQIPFDRKSFNPHITLLRNASGSKEFADIEVRKASMIVGSFSLIRSNFGRHGAVYTEIGSVELNRI